MSIRLPEETKKKGIIKCQSLSESNKWALKQDMIQGFNLIKAKRTLVDIHNPHSCQVVLGWEFILKSSRKSNITPSIEFDSTNMDPYFPLMGYL